MGSLSAKEFSVKDLQGLSLWLKADAGVTLAGSNVTEWADQSGNGRNATPNDPTNKPLFNASDKNGKPTISLTSMSDYIERVFTISSNPLGASGSTAFSVQYVEDVCGAFDDNGPIFGNFGGSEDSFGTYQSHYPYGPDCFVYDAFGTRLRKNEITPPVTITNAWTLYSVKSTNNDWQSFVNGQLMYSDPTNTYSSAVGGDDATLYIGKQTAAGTFRLKGKVAEVIVYNRVLTTSERQKVEAYLNAKYAIYSPIKNTKISIKKQNLGGGKLKTYNNILLNSRFDKNNDYPFNGFDANYNIGGPLAGGSQILGNYYHNSPLFYDAGGYRTIANKTFHEINSPYTTLLYGHTLQPRLLKMFGAGSKFGALNNTNYLKTITSTTSYTPTDNESWTKYGVEQIIAIPSWARKVKYGVKYLIISGDEFRFNNFGGLEVYFQKGSNRSYVNLNMVRKPVSVDTTALDSLETLYTLNNYVNFDSAYANAMCQWLGPNTSRVKVKRRPSVYIDGSNLDIFNVLSDTIDIPTFSTSGGSPDYNNGFPDYISIQMFFAEWVSYLNDSGIQSGAIYFYEPFLYFTEF